jgi:hypothetical protein
MPLKGAVNESRTKIETNGSNISAINGIIRVMNTN